ncbi:RNA polymerase sigma factor [Halobacillus shinanisalinarum]|uniref:RNA polymerase sigma factor n=1 Tax=Halobacillus shinanisalinarum TaxID=2932258 RepID=A0ABY4GUR3_9BACI|nr:RNA polymerase sigma factor [Halobacillus shinanisalinarum]UOQ91635.1 RNA polymerase sigma factor [Halobacillus shinanisalinarum]
MNEGFEEIYQFYYHRVYHAAFRVTKDHKHAEDILQETFIKAYQKIDQIEKIDKIGAWLSTTATRASIDFLRREKKVVVAEVEELLLQRCETRSIVEEHCEEREMEEVVRLEVGTLSSKLRKVFHLKYYGHLKEAEIAEKLELSPSAVKSRLYRAKICMKKQMAGLIEQNQTA